MEKLRKERFLSKLTGRVIAHKLRLRQRAARESRM
jgi:hypothetical protein